MTLVAHLDAAELDRIAIELHRRDDPDFDLPYFDGPPAHLGAYAPDPDADYARGLADGLARGRMEARVHRAFAPLDLAVGALAVAVLIVALVAAGIG